MLSRRPRASAPALRARRWRRTRSGRRRVFLIVAWPFEGAMASRRVAVPAVGSICGERGRRGGGECGRRALADARRGCDRECEPARRPRARDPDRAASELPDLDARCPGGCARCDRRRCRRAGRGRTLCRRRARGRSSPSPRYRHCRLHGDGGDDGRDRSDNGRVAGGCLAGRRVGGAGTARPLAERAAR